MVKSKETIALDTNVFISVINKESDYVKVKKILDWIDAGEIKGIVSTIVLAEICFGYDSNKNYQEEQEEQAEKHEFLSHLSGSSNYEIVAVDIPIALEARTSC